MSFRRVLAAAALSLGLLGLITPATPAVPRTAGADPASMLSPGDIPASLGTAVPPAIPLMTLPSHAVLQVCQTQGWQATVPGPRSFSQVIVPIATTPIATVSELAYQYPSAAAASKAWDRLLTAMRACDRSRVIAGAGGSTRTTLTNGSLPGITAYAQVWVNHRDVPVPSSGSKGADVRFSVFTLADDAILVTSLTRMDARAVSGKDRAAVGRLAQMLSDRWEHPAA